MLPDDEDAAASAPDILRQVNWEAIPEPEREILHTVMHAQFEMIRSPLLPPKILKEYDEVVPGLATKLVEWTEQESQHRRKLEQASFDEVRLLRSRGQNIGLTVSIVGLGLSSVTACFAAFFDSLGSAGVATVIAIVAVGGPFAARLLANKATNNNPSPGEE
jgi:uncharacterized membrane protein